ncbi:MAG: efflux transporter outer membrane subunit [Rhodospirillales bacterium]|nr:efflux transporter outer membrane subunit [Rhodospirillales bacterium]
MRAPLPALVLMAVALSGCSLAPDFRLPDLALPDWWTNADPPPPAQPPLEMPAPGAWWKEFASSDLDALQARALANNRDLKAAIARIEQAQAQADAASAPLWPTFGLSGQGQVAKRSSSASSSSSSTRTTTSSAGTLRSYQASLTASYEIDFWGKTRSGIEAAEQGLAASEFDRDTVALTLTANVATTWFQALALAERVAAAKRNLEIARQSLELAEKQEAFGKTSALEAAQQRSAVALIEAQVPALELQRRQALDTLALYCGLTNSAGLADRVALGELPVPAVRPGLPAALLLSRPDIRKAEANLKAANANIGIARAQLFPLITLTGDRGYSSIYLDTLLDPKSAFWTLGGNLAVTLFDHGKLLANVRLSEAKMKELAESYQGAILAALKDVEDGLAATRWLALQEDAQTQAVMAAKEAQRLADIRYREGAVDYLAVLEAQRTLLQAEDGAIQVRLARLNAAVGLFKALGSAPPP